MTPTDIESYLQQLDRELRRRFVVDPSIQEEVRGHLADAIERSLQRGDSFAIAQADAIQRFGTAAAVADAFAADRSRVRYRCLLVAAILFGVAIAYVDAQPTWDDTGITAGAMTLIAAALGLLGPRRPWAWALMVGIGIPAHAIVRSPSLGAFAMLIVLVFPLTGAYLGMAVRRAMTPVTR